MKERVILHVDMNNCYASIELLDHPEWIGKPFAVAGDVKERHGIILAKSREAKQFGIKTGEPIWQAFKKCPNLILGQPHFEKYLYFSKLARKIYCQYSCQVEPFGLDECWLDVTDSVPLFGSGIEIAELIRQRVKQELGITVSIGVSFTKSFAKLASDLSEPDCKYVIPKSRMRDMIWPLPIQSLLGIGPATRKKLYRYNITTLGELAQCDPLFLQQIFGVAGKKIWLSVHGLETSPVLKSDDDIPIKSIGNGLTYSRDLLAVEEIHSSLQNLAMRVSRRLHQEGYLAEGLELTVKNNHLENFQYSQRLDRPTASAQLLAKSAFHLYTNKYTIKNFPVRSLTLRCSHLVPTSACRQLSFFTSSIDENWECLDHTVYQLNQRYGRGKLSYGLQYLAKNLSAHESDITVLPIRTGVS